jgi:hypothetical protein
MSDGPDKRQILEAAAKRAIEKQPEEIHLIAAPKYAWSNAAAVEAHASTIVRLGFSDAGTYTIDPLGVAVRFFLKVSDRMYSVIYEHPKAGTWLNFVVLYEDGSNITFTTTQDRGLEQRPGHPIVHSPGATADNLYSIAVSKAPPNGRKPLSPESIVIEFEQAWAEGIRWKKDRGVSMTEVASLLFSRDGRDARILRPDRIQYIAEQDGTPERELKARFVKVFAAYPALEKAYLVFLRYDEAPQGSVALCLATSSKDMTLVDAIRKTFAELFSVNSHLDILFVAPSEAARVEQVCQPFYRK